MCVSLYDSDITAETPEHLSELQAYITAPHNDQVLRDDIKVENRATCR